MGSRTAPVVSSSDDLSSSENKVESKGTRACSDYYANILPADVIEELNNLVPSVHFFNLLYSLNKDRNTDWYNFCARQGRQFLGSIPDSIKQWKSKFFFISYSEDWGFPIKWGVPRTHIANKEKPDPNEMKTVKGLQKRRLGPLNEFLTDRLLQENGLYLAMGDEMPSDKGVDIADRMRAISRAKKQKEKALSKTKGQVVSGAPSEKKTSDEREKKTSDERGKEAMVKASLPKPINGTDIGTAKGKGLSKSSSSRKRG
ncbi:hypothetical protein J5N97_017389 [Dioscorea zingiberensis]|uniref:Uncharacterized protein n=1 Tax=Dioscorea zingiberensis TaxID=325984 RepID=A0A9D5HGA8_9LILI|nr:hypothetical protein J5N97_017389 [Dioscorea zingiberensis]